MKLFQLLILCFILSTTVTTADDKVYTDQDLQPEPQIYTKDPFPSYKPQIAPQPAPLQNHFEEWREPAPRVQPTINMQQPPQPQYSPPPVPYPLPKTDQDAFASALTFLCSIWLIVVGIPLLLWIITLIDILRNEFTGSNKIVWIIVTTFLPLLGPILYFFIGTDHKIRHEDPDRIERITDY